MKMRKLCAMLIVLAMVLSVCPVLGVGAADSAVVAFDSSNLEISGEQRITKVRWTAEEDGAYVRFSQSWTDGGVWDTSVKGKYALMFFAALKRETQDSSATAIMSGATKTSKTDELEISFNFAMQVADNLYQRWYFNDNDNNTFASIYFDKNSGLNVGTEASNGDMAVVVSGQDKTYDLRGALMKITAAKTADGKYTVTYEVNGTVYKTETLDSVNGFKSITASVPKYNDQWAAAALQNLKISYVPNAESASLVSVGDSAVASLDFDGNEGGCNVTIKGTAAYESSMDGYGKAASVGNGFSMDVVSYNGQSLLSGADSFTVLFDAKAAASEALITVANASGKTLTASGAGDDDWHRIVTSYTETSKKVYIDGELASDESGAYDTANVLSGSTVAIGGTGLIDNITIFDRELTLDQINEYMVTNVTPTMNVSGGTETNPVDFFTPITITHPMGDSYIYYTTDGTEPTTSSNKYEGPFHADGVAHIIACAIAPDGSKSGNVEAWVYSKKWAATAAVFRIEGENTVNNGKIGWPLYDGADLYKVYRGETLVGTATGDCLDDYNLEVNKNYSYTVKAYSGDTLLDEASTNTITTFAVDLTDISGYDDNIEGKWVALENGYADPDANEQIASLSSLTDVDASADSEPEEEETSAPSPSGYNINGKYYQIQRKSVTREELVEWGLDATVIDKGCNVMSIRYMESDDGINWPEEYTVLYPVFADLRFEGAHNDFRSDEQAISVSAHAEGTSGYGTAKLFFATFMPHPDAQDVEPYMVTVAGGTILTNTDPSEQYEKYDNPGRNQLQGYYIGRPFGYDSRDMVRFIDGGRLYTFSATNMNQDMLILLMDEDWIMPEKVVNVILKGKHQESPSVFHDGNAYYVYTSTTNGWYTSQARYSSAETLDSQWSPLREVGNAGTFGTQANGVWGYGSESGRTVWRGHGYNWGQSGGWRKNNYQRFFDMAINDGVATGAWCSKMEYHPYWGAIAVQSGEYVSLGKKATLNGKDAPDLTDNLQLQSSTVTDVDSLPYDIVVDLEKPTVITEVNLTNAIYMGSTCGSYFKAYGSNDQSNWTLISDQTGGDYDDPTFRVGTVTDKTPYRYVKVTVEDVRNFQNGNQALWGGKPLEVAIYGKPEGYVDEQYEFTDEILVGYDRKNIDFEPYGQAPVIVNDRTLVPLRAIFEAMGATVNWDDATKTVTASRDGVEISLQIGSNQLYVNGEAKEIDTPAQIINERTMVPVRAIAESFGCEVNWDQDARRVYIEEAE